MLEEQAERTIGEGHGDCIFPSALCKTAIPRVASHGLEVLLIILCCYLLKLGQWWQRQENASRGALALRGHACETKIVPLFAKRRAFPVEIAEALDGDASVPDHANEELHRHL
ncbi:hypothetical protein NE237_007452 [Protea cynaroides]|uniref:Uncharacterized protein n=1 Tax=Protea cynaroides TaxID=273540 RepID=A0A9Q0QW87_9MAGN|nr:hypothetical protein NE237_007452 [Protea cynaroides]